jgi:hypothetical protein
MESSTGGEGLSQLSPALDAAVRELLGLLHPEDEWTPVVIPMPDTARLLASPLGALVAALGDTPEIALRTRRWGRLCVAVCRRVQACWDLRCDVDPLTPMIQAAADRLFRGVVWDARLGLEHCPIPTYRGADLPDDCTITCPNLVALAVTWCVSFAADPVPNYVIGCVREADRGMSESPLGNRDQFRRWVLQFAVPAAWEDRDLTRLEQGALRSYNAELVNRWRDG